MNKNYSILTFNFYYVSVSVHMNKEFLKLTSSKKISNKKIVILHKNSGTLTVYFHNES